MVAILTMAASTLPTRADEPVRPNIIWINAEDMGPNMGCYGDPQAATPTLDKLASRGIRFTQAFATAPICSPSRSALITGVYATSLGSQHLRCEVTLPDSIRPFPTILRENGYFTTNYGKTDFNFSPDGVFDYWKSDFAPWRQRTSPDQPFFSYFVLGRTHEGRGNSKAKYDEATADLPGDMRQNPESVSVPPYFPDTPEMRDILARYSDLISAMDLEVATILKNLEDDGLLENSIIWFFSDHGHGLPRHKRWLMDSGLRVPLIISSGSNHSASSYFDKLRQGQAFDGVVSFVDFAPTVLEMAGCPIPESIQGEPISELFKPRRLIKYAFGARSRADDMFEMSRSVHDGRFIYIRHFMPHLPYIQGGAINSDRKESYAELRRARINNSDNNPLTSLIWQSQKPTEELYDLTTDPFEIQNLADDPEYGSKLQQMRIVLTRWMQTTRDTGIFMEDEYHLRADEESITIYEWIQGLNPREYMRVLTTASQVGNPNLNVLTNLKLLDNREAGVRFWGTQAARHHINVPNDLRHRLYQKLVSLLDDPSPSVSIGAAETLIHLNSNVSKALETLMSHLDMSSPHSTLHAARTLFHAGPAASPVAEEIQKFRKSLESPQPTPNGRRYRDFNFYSFTGWALEWALIECGHASPNDFTWP